MPGGRYNKSYKGSRKRKKFSKKSTNQAKTGEQSTASSSSKQEDETSEEMVKPPKQQKIVEPTKEVQGTDDDSFEAKTADDSDLPSYNRPLNLNEPVTGDDSITSESPNINTPNEMQIGDIAHREPQPSGIHKTSNPDDPPSAIQLKFETEDKQHDPLPSVTEESNLDDLSTASELKSETETKQDEPQTSSVPQESNIDNSTTDKQLVVETEDTKSEAQTSSGEKKVDDSPTTSKEKEEKNVESAGKLETELDTDGSSTITCSSKDRCCSETGSDKESSDSEGSKGVSLSSVNKESESGSVFSYSASDESGPPSVASVASSVPPLGVDTSSAYQETTTESQGEENVQQENSNVVVPEFMLRKYKEFSSSSGSDNRNEEA